MSMTQRYAGMLRRHAAEWDKQEMPVQAECVRQAARHMEEREQKLERLHALNTELLEALKGMVDYYGTASARVEQLDSARAAIAKAEEVKMTTCNIDPKHPAALVPTPESSSITCQVGDKLWCVMHKPTGTLLHIRINDDAGNLIFTSPDNLDWWIGRDEAQAKAQAAALGDDFVAAFFVCTGKGGDDLSPTFN